MKNERPGPDENDSSRAISTVKVNMLKTGNKQYQTDKLILSCTEKKMRYSEIEKSFGL